MEESPLNLKVNDYSQDDLLELLGLLDKDPVTYDDIINASTPYINKYTSFNINNNFF